MSDEILLWKGSPSQWLNLGPFLIVIILVLGLSFGGLFFPPLFFGLIIPVAYLFWRYLVIRTQIFEITTERLRITRGVFNQTVDEIELYRIKDSQMIRPWWMRLTGLGSISMETSDRTMPTFVIPAVADGVAVRELLRQQVEAQRDLKRVREMDFDDAEDTGNNG